MQISVCLNSRLVATETEFAETLHGSHSQQHNGNQQHFRLHMATILQKLFLSLHTVWLQILISFGSQKLIVCYRDCGLAWQQQLCFILYHTAFLLAHALHHFLWFVGAIYGSAHWQSSSTNWMVFTVDTETFFPCLIPKQRKAAVCTVIFVSSQDPYKGWWACLNHTTSTASCQCFYQPIHWGVDVDRLGADRELAPEIGCPTRHSVTLVLLKEAPCECSQTAASVASSSGSLWHFIYITQHNLSPPERWAHLAHSRGGLAGPVILNSLVR